MDHEILQGDGTTVGALARSIIVYSGRQNHRSESMAMFVDGSEEGAKNKEE